jgi:hypothetical protein
MSDDLKNVGTSSMLTSGFEMIKAHATTQETGQGEQSEKLLAFYLANRRRP